MDIEDLLIGIVILMLFGWIFICIDIVFSSKETVYGVVIDKNYQAERSSVGVGTAVTSNGSIGTVVTSSSESEKFLIMVKLQDKSIVTADCDVELYYQKNIGDSIKINASKGCLTHNTYYYNGEK